MGFQPVVNRFSKDDRLEASRFKVIEIL